MTDFKVGDRFSVEGVVTELIDPDGEYCALFDGADSDDYVAGSIMAHATLIEPADKVAEEKVLDLSKPVQFKYATRKIKSVFGPASYGTYMVEEENGAIDVYTRDLLENVPEPKRVMSREVYMVEGLDFLVMEGGATAYRKILARGPVTLTEGDGMEEIK